MQSYQDRIAFAHALAACVNNSEPRDVNKAKVWYTRNSEADHGTVRVYLTHKGVKCGFANVPASAELTFDARPCLRQETFEPLLALVFTEDAAVQAQTFQTALAEIGQEAYQVEYPKPMGEPIAPIEPLLRSPADWTPADGVEVVSEDAAKSDKRD